MATHLEDWGNTSTARKKTGRTESTTLTGYVMAGNKKENSFLA